MSKQLIDRKQQGYNIAHVRRQLTVFQFAIGRL
jgi:hypothetical protein